jgi:hypothetical protein
MSSAVNVPTGPRLTRSFWTLVPMVVKASVASYAPLTFVVSVTEVMPPFSVWAVKEDVPRTKFFPDSPVDWTSTVSVPAVVLEMLSVLEFRMPGINSADWSWALTWLTRKVPKVIGPALIAPVPEGPKTEVTKPLSERVMVMAVACAALPPTAASRAVPVKRPASFVAFALRKGKAAVAAKPGA